MGLFLIYQVHTITNNSNSCLAHVINLATQTLISTYSKAPHYSPHNLKSHKPNTAQKTNRDEIGLIRSICVKISWVIFQMCIMLTSNLKQECSPAKRKELYRIVQTKAEVLHPTQLLIDMKVQWSSTYVMLNHAESHRKVLI